MPKVCCHRWELDHITNMVRQLDFWGVVNVNKDCASHLTWPSLPLCFDTSLRFILCINMRHLCFKWRAELIPLPLCESSHGRCYVLSDWMSGQTKHLCCVPVDSYRYLWSRWRTSFSWEMTPATENHFCNQVYSRRQERERLLGKYCNDRSLFMTRNPW